MPEVPSLGNGATDNGAAEQLTLANIRGCRGVNALAEDQEIVFNPRMTVLFGENASGKTGYVRVLKRLANVRSAEAIIPDIHRPAAAGWESSNKSAPEAVIGYVLGKEKRELVWRNESGVVPFTRMSVFDSPAVRLHLEDNVTYVYTPADLALFKYVHAAIEAVKHLLEADVSGSQPRQNPFVTAFTRGTPIYPKIEGLSASTSQAELEQLATVSDAELAEREALKLSVEALTSTSTEGRAEMLRSRRTVLENLITLADAMVGFQPEAFLDASAAEAAARNQQANAAAAVFSAGTLPAEVRPAWQAFLEAGENYLQASGQTAYPSAHDECIYCRQTLDDAAVVLLARYRQYASGAVSVAVESSGRQVRHLAAILTGPDVASALGTLDSLLAGIEEGGQAPEWAADGHRLVDRVVELREAVASGSLIDAVEAKSLSTALLPRLRAAVSETRTTLTALDGTAQARVKQLSQTRTRLATLEARVALARLLPEIRTYLERAALADRLKTLIGRFQGLLKGLTEVTKVASEEVLNRDFERLFHEECAALRAPTVTLDFPGRRGQAARRKIVAADYSLPEILSEGEQKVIAIADFLAEASLRTGSAPIVFDDPVTSLDHRRLHEVVKRVAALADQHQVVVFTHNIWFASELLAQFENRPDCCAYYQVVEDGGQKGVISRGGHPRFDTISQVRGRINSAIQDAKAARIADRPGKVEAAYDHIRVWCELVVEGDLLAKVTQRYQPNVAMTNLEHIKPERLKSAIAVILPIFEKACRYMPGHSQPLDTLGVRATLEELTQDWAELQDALKAYKAD